MLVDDEELGRRRVAFEENGYAFPASQTPWQEIHRNMTGQFAEGAVLEHAVKYQRVAQVHAVPRDSH
jgi:dihydroxy-acid dehydratase